MDEHPSGSNWQEGLSTLGQATNGQPGGQTVYTAQPTQPYQPFPLRPPQTQPLPTVMSEFGEPNSQPAPVRKPATSPSSIVAGIIIFTFVAGIIAAAAYFLFRTPAG